MKNVLIASYDMEVGGVERSLAGMLDQFNYTAFNVDLMLYRHKGDFMSLLTDRANLLSEIPQYTSFRKSIAETLKDKQLPIGIARIMAKAHAGLYRRMNRIEDIGYVQMQMVWKYAMPFLPPLKSDYDVAISYLWPHDFVANKVTANRKVAWIHTDYSTIAANHQLDLEIWDKFDYIIAVSEACRNSFLERYESLRVKVFVIENIVAPIPIQSLSIQPVEGNPLVHDSRFKLLSVGRLCHAKGFDDAIRAFKLLIDKGYDNLVWYIVGYGGDEAMLRALIEEYELEDRFILLGKQINPYPFMSQCDLYVQPSRYEGKAVTVTEAQILGKPIVITNYATAASQIEHLKDGYIAELSVAGIADGIERLYNDHELRAQLADYCSSSDYSNSGELEKLYMLLEAEGVTEIDDKG
ncbi:glycosyltransferase [Paenibacillus sinopodophylli]|uniref:glycosyltransferase n=1 Tax=Paenibacillus sinopodophylli TaxID=1837342 RepID=UPI00110D120D|nr:glycosyltransferase [Paenibacillus sinopodophylli]